MIKLILAIIGIGILASFLPAPSDNDAANKQAVNEARADIDFSQPIFTAKFAVVCPIDILFEKRQGKGLAAASAAALTAIGRSKAITEAGCEEWKQGVRLYIPHADPSLAWQKATISSSGIEELLVLKATLTNKAE